MNDKTSRYCRKTVKNFSVVGDQAHTLIPADPTHRLSSPLPFPAYGINKPGTTRLFLDL